MVARFKIDSPVAWFIGRYRKRSLGKVGRRPPSRALIGRKSKIFRASARTLDWRAIEEPSSWDDRCGRSEGR